MSGMPVLLFLDISGGELLVIMLVVFLVFGPEKMPEMARKAGRLMNQMKKASGDLTREFKKETSELQNEISSAQTQVRDQVESVNREFNRNKVQVETEMAKKKNPAETPDSGIPAEAPLTENPTAAASPQPADNTTPAE
jgi:Tat protein translocase TatB subunit